MDCRVDAVVLAGGSCSAEMAQRTGVTQRALVPWRGVPFVRHVVDALRASPRVARIAVIGPPSLQSLLPDVDLVLPERATIVENVIAAMEALGPRGHVLVTASDNPLLTPGAFTDLVVRTPDDAAVAVPILARDAFLDRFPAADNVCIRLRDGVWIGGCAVLIDGRALPKVRRAIERVLRARKSMLRMVGLLGPLFAARFAFRRVTVGEVEARACDVAGVPVRFVRDCDPAFPIDLDEPADLDYLLQWEQTTRS